MLLTQNDHDHLFNLLRSSGARVDAGTAIAELARKIDAATIVSATAIPADVVTMNSIVALMELSTGETSTYTLVYPKNADVDGLKISVLARLGVALLGESEGEVVEYSVPSGIRRYFIRKVIYQPESRLREEENDGAVAA